MTIEQLLGHVNKRSIFSYIMSRLIKFPNKSIKTAAVALLGRGPSTAFYYDPEFFVKLYKINPKYPLGIVKHECYHVLFGHIFQRGPKHDKQKQFLWNIAADLSINQLIPRDELYTKDELSQIFPEANPDDLIVCIPGEDKFKKLPVGLSAEQYYILLLNDEELQKQLGMGENSLINEAHKMWETFENLSDEEKEKIRGDLEAEMKKEGRLPGELSQQLHKLMPESKAGPQGIDKLLNKIEGISISLSRYESSRKRVNKRFQEYPGRKKVKFVKSIIVAVDHSGSVSDEKLSGFFAFLRYINKSYPITFIPFTDDAHMDMIQNFEPTKFKLEFRNVSGGTDVNKTMETILQKYRGDYIYLVVSDFETSEIKKELIGPRTFGVVFEEDINSLVQNGGSAFKEKSYVIENHN